MPPFLFKKERSPIHGVGIYTKQSLRTGEVFYVVPTGQVSSTPKQHWAKTGDAMWVNDPAVLNWVNHSCNPSSELIFSELKPSKLRALRDIPLHEEITVDYNKTEIGGSKIPCSCNSKNCRGYFLRVE